MLNNEEKTIYRQQYDAELLVAIRDLTKQLQSLQQRFDETLEGRLNDILVAIEALQNPACESRNPGR
jgi:hypothetical protein